MIESLKKTFKETLIAVLPICFVVVLISLMFDINTTIINSFLFSTVLLIMGITLFTFGADSSMMVVGEKLGNKLISSKNILKILIVTFIIGIAITLAEPDLKVLATQITSIPSAKLIIFVSIGVGFFLTITILKYLFKLSLNTILIISYTLLLVMLMFVPSDFIPISFDSSGVTTGPISAPFILALGIGLASLRTDKNSKNDTFGLIGLCSIGPKLTVLLLGMIFVGTNTFDSSIYTNNMSFSEEFLTCLKEVFISLSPILLLFLAFKIFTTSFNSKQTKRIIIGFISTLIGLGLFLTGVNFGFMTEGFTLGQRFINYNYKEFLIPFTMLIGFLVVFAEPAIKILSNKVDEMTEGSISSKMMKTTISIGVTIAVLLSVIRVFTGLSIVYILVPGYIIALVLTFITPKMFTAIAFDAGGSVCGPLTVTFILPLLIGVCISLNGNIYADAFGLIALIAMSPVITIQLLGIIFKIKTKVQIYRDIDEEIIDYDWRSIC